MAELKLPHTHCAIQGCKTSIFNKGMTTSFHSFPTTPELKNKWIFILRNKCALLDCNKSKICSKHFENRYFDSSRKLKDNAVPSIFPNISSQKTTKTVDASQKNKVDRLLNRMTQTELTENINATMRLIKVPDNFSDCVDDDLECVPDTPVEAQLWLLIKKQDHLITRLSPLGTQNQKHVDILKKNLEDLRSDKKNMEKSIESYKYIVKCLQEKHATLEEQIEILTAVESR